MKKFYTTLIVFTFTFSGFAQEYLRMISSGDYSVQDIQVVAEAYFDQVGRERGKGYKPYKRWEYQALRRMDENGMLKSPEFYFNVLENYNSYLNTNFSAARTTVGSWEQLGPLDWNQTSGWNPGVGRITALSSESGNSEHLIIGANTGGVWKTLDGGNSWTVLTDNMSNLTVFALAIDPTNPSNYFWGSSEGTLFKSEDAGATWNLLSDLGDGNINKIIIDPSSPNKMYCTAQYGGIFKSTDSGATWDLIDGNPSNGYDVEFKPGDYNTIYASGNTFYKSTDGGNTFVSPNGLNQWSQAYLSGSNNWSTASTNQNNSVTPRTGNAMGFLYVGDFSIPITQLISPELNLAGMATPQLHFSFTNVNWEGDIDSLRILYKTSVNGAWIELANYTEESTAWNDITLPLPNPSATYYIAFEGTANYGRGITLDDISVEDATAGIIFEDGFESATNTFGGGPKMIAVSPADPEAVFVLEALGNYFGGLHKSSDGGESFSKLDHTGKNYFGYSSDAQDPGDATSGQAPRDMDIAISQSNIDDVHIAGVNSWRSTDGGLSFTITSQWTPSGALNGNIGYCHADIDLLEFIGNELYVCSDGGIFVAEAPTNVSSSYYTDLTTGLGIRQFYKLGISQTDPVIVTGGSQDNGSSILGTDGIWREWLGADGFECFVDKNNNNIIYGEIYNGLLYKSLDGGNTSFGLPSPEGKSGNWLTPFEQDPIAANTVYTGYDEVYKSVDGGFSWTSVSQNFGANLDHLKIAPSNGNFQYAASGINLYRNSNVGTTTNWTTLSGFDGYITSIAVHPTNPSKVAIATSGSEKVYVSSDAGNTWVSYALNLPDFSAQALIWDNNDTDGFYLGMNYGVFYIDNTLTEWQPFSNNLPNVTISELEINHVNNKIYAATYGRGLWASDLYDETLSASTFQLNSLTVYPNPATNALNLKWDQNNKVTINIFNALGKVMYYEKDQNIQNELKIDISNYAAGLYFVKVNTTKGSMTKKIIVE
ncbi:T9SS type A sorting domain-containing protein [Sediminibacter sp. Hel_I_10]|uniref:VPS10 domain-containing protein n=1 Tax=Sediminibacter sp. Hel_I_10 TaxID=1392490 RepID=UPI0004790AC4|nr:T9SS type A sorting domain-containing protein [Sediminibacter sp. Hel_I_10]